MVGAREEWLCRVAGVGRGVVLAAAQIALSAASTVLAVWVTARAGLGRFRLGCL